MIRTRGAAHHPSHPTTGGTAGERGGGKGGNSGSGDEASPSSVPPSSSLSSSGGTLATVGRSAQNPTTSRRDDDDHRRPRPRRGGGFPTTSPYVIAIIVASSALLFFGFLFLVRTFDEDPRTTSSPTGRRDGSSSNDNNHNPIDSRRKEASTGGMLLSSSSSLSSSGSCPYASLQDLTDLERHPRATSTRHTVDPPRRPIVSLTTTKKEADDDTTTPDEQEEEAQESRKSKVTLVCCHTTKGPWSIVVHEAWAPLGSQRFLDMVTSNYFEGNNNPNDKEDYGVPLMRCVHHFLCQFGLAGKFRSEQFQTSLRDDPQWLPEGPAHRVNQIGVKRFQKGYLSYAGGGPNTRDNQLFVALGDNGPLGGGSPWEVPWGELVGNHSYETLDRIYSGYGENGPTQHLLWQDKALPIVRKEFPKLDWILSCHVVDEGTEE